MTSIKVSHALCVKQHNRGSGVLHFPIIFPCLTKHFRTSLQEAGTQFPTSWKKNKTKSKDRCKVTVEHPVTKLTKTSSFAHCGPGRVTRVDMEFTSSTPMSRERSSLGQSCPSMMSDPPSTERPPTVPGKGCSM